MNRKVWILVAAALFFVPLTAAADQQKLASGEILVSTQDVAGSDVPRVTVTGVIDAPPSVIWEIVSNCDRYPGRMPRIDAAREISREGSTVVCEVTVGLPFPLSDLTARTRATHTVGPPAWKREWTLIEGDYKTNDGSWVLTTFGGDENRTLAVYTVHAEPNSRVPQSMRRRAQQSSMPGIIERLRELVAE